MRILEVVLFIVGILMSVAYLTVAERKTLGYMQRRLGPNAVGYYGLLQAFADAAKLLFKEIIIPKESNYLMLILAPVITLLTALLGWAVIPLTPWSYISQFDYGLLIYLSISSLGVFGILLAGWSANSKYALMGSIRSTAQLISYELVLTSVIIIIVYMVGSLNIMKIIEAQRAIWFLLPFLPLFLIFFISSVAETNRPPFDLPEAESELVAGFMTEHSASPFVFFFLGEYSNIALISSLNVILFMGSYLTLPFSIDYLLQLINIESFSFIPLNFSSIIPSFITNSIPGLPGMDYVISSSPYLTYSLSSLSYAVIFAIKLNLLLFTFIWIRASFPRFRYDQLIYLCWMVLLPLVFAFILIVPCTLYILDALPLNL
jgi:NADH-ubiquinone oxidoreductase chain 1